MTRQFRRVDAEQPNAAAIAMERVAINNPAIGNRLGIARSGCS
jgi:hypothetical protein